MSHIGQRFDGLRYTDSLEPGVILTTDQNWHEATREQKQQNRRMAITIGEVILSGILVCGAPPVGAVLGLIFIGENIVRYSRLNKTSQT